MWAYNGPLEPCGENGFGMVNWWELKSDLRNKNLMGIAKEGLEKSLDYIYGSSIIRVSRMIAHDHV